MELAPWSLTILADLWLKHQLMREGAYDECLIGAGKSILTAHEKFTLYGSDLLWGFFLVPVLLLLMGALLPRRWRSPLSGLMAIAAIFLMISQYFALRLTGSFVSLKLIVGACLWVGKSLSPQLITLPHENLHRIFCLLALLLVSGALLALLRLFAEKALHWAMLLLFVGGNLVAAAAWLDPHQPMVWSQSILSMSACEALAGNNELSFGHHPSQAQLIDEIRHHSRTPQPATTPWTGSAAGRNVLFFVMESISDEAVDPARDPLDDLPNLRWLRDRSLVAAEHYTTYPYTNLATFAIFSSLYAFDPPGVELKSHPVAVPSLLQSLKTQGYQSAYYGFIWHDGQQRDDAMLRALGFDQIVEPNLDSHRDRDGDETFHGPASYCIAHDTASLAQLRSQIATWNAHKQHFVATYFPEVGHDPYRQLTSGPNQDDRTRGRALVRLQDAWLGQILDDLRRQNQLNNTLIIVTSDHGMRYLAETPKDVWAPIQMGTFKDQTMHVPLIVSLPGRISKPITISRPTAHLDLMPTVLDLLGVQSGRELEEGLPITDPAIADRRLYLFSDIFGSAGSIDHGRYDLCVSKRLGFRSNSMSFGRVTELPFGSPGAREICQDLDIRRYQQQQLLDNLYRGASH